MFFGYPLEKHTFQDFTGFWRKLKPISLARIPVFLSEIVVSKTTTLFLYHHTMSEQGARLIAANRSLWTV